MCHAFCCVLQACGCWARTSIVLWRRRRIGLMPSCTAEKTTPTLLTMEDMDIEITYSFWIGYHDRWQWSLSDGRFYREGEADYRNWQEDEPNDCNLENCTFLGESGEWYNGKRNQALPFICYNGEWVVQSLILKSLIFKDNIRICDVKGFLCLNKGW